MAILFMLAADCGQDRKCATAIVDHFASAHFQLSDGTEIRFKRDPEAVWTWGDATWCWVVPEGVSADGTTQRIHSTALRVELTQRIHAELRLFSGYRFALVGWEAASVTDWDEIAGAADRLESLPSGLIVGEDLYRRLGCPAGFERFGSDTWWRPLSDEGYAELVSLGEE